MLAGLPLPEVNQPIYDEHGQWLAEPDLHYKAARLAIEYNGSDHATLDRMRKDATRTLDLLRADWLVRVYTAVDAFRRLEAVVADTRGILARRAPQLLTAVRYRPRPRR